MKIVTKYNPKKPVSMFFVIICSICLLLTIGRWYSVIDNDFVVFTAEIHDHISNFSLSILAYLFIGYFWLLLGAKFRVVIILGAFMTIANFVCETLMGFMNTPDIVDALYGTVGIAAAFVFLLITNKYGLNPKDAE